MTDRERKAILKLIGEGIREFPKVLARKERAYKEKQRRLKAFIPVSKELKRKSDAAAKAEVHPWRLCPLGQFYRKSHRQSSYVRSDGVRVKQSFHPDECVVSKDGKDHLYPEEMREIALRNFGMLVGVTVVGKLPQFNNESDFDHLIRGWTHYWNAILSPKELLDPNLVKALIASESSFNPSPKGTKASNRLKARGLMQVTNSTRKFLAGGSKELDDHLVHVDLEDMADPNLNIACGVRWLFRKKEIAESHKAGASWDDTILEYKGCKSPEEKPMKIFFTLYNQLKT